MIQGKFILIIIFSLVFSSIRSQTGSIKGHIYNRKQKEGLAFANVWLEGTDKSAITDLDGDFKIDSIIEGTYNVHISYVGIADTTLSTIKITSGNVVSLKLEFPPPCKYDRSEKNKKCPICGKMDKVVPIVYGLPIGKLDEKNFYYAGCEITMCDPNWFCKRNNYKF